MVDGAGVKCVALSFAVEQVQRQRIYSRLLLSEYYEPILGFGIRTVMCLNKRAPHECAGYSDWAVVLGSAYLFLRSDDDYDQTRTYLKTA